MKDTSYLECQISNNPDDEVRLNCLKTYLDSYSKNTHFKLLENIIVSEESLDMRIIVIKYANDNSLEEFNEVTNWAFSHDKKLFYEYCSSLLEPDLKACKKLGYVVQLAVDRKQYDDLFKNGLFFIRRDISWSISLMSFINKIGLDIEITKTSDGPFREVNEDLINDFEEDFTLISNQLYLLSDFPEVYETMVEYVPKIKELIIEKVKYEIKMNSVTPKEREKRLEKFMNWAPRRSW
jgi:hypothetical protein